MKTKFEVDISTWPGLQAAYDAGWEVSGVSTPSEGEVYIDVYGAVVKASVSCAGTVMRPILRRRTPTVTEVINEALHKVGLHCTSVDSEVEEFGIGMKKLYYTATIVHRRDSQ